MPKISDYAADTAPTSDDLIITVNTPGTTPTNKKVTIGNLFLNAPPIKVLDPFTNELVNANALEITNAEALAGSFHISQYRQNNEEPTETRKDQCLMIGYNSKKGGGVVLTGEHGLSFTFENYWHSLTEGPQCEFHLDYVATDGATTRRPIDCGVNLATHAVTLCLNAEDIYLQSVAASPYWQFIGGTAWAVGANARIVRDRNNYQFLQQKNAAGTGYPSLMYLNNSNQIVIGDDGSQSSITAGIVILDPVGLANGQVLRINSVQVVGARVVDARCDDAINSGDGTTDGVIDSLRDAMITHGLIAAAA